MNIPVLYSLNFQIYWFALWHFILDDPVPVESLVTERRRAVHTYSVTHETITRFIYDLSSLVKFIYSEKAKIFCEISIIDLTDTTYVCTVYTVEIYQNFVAFSG